jgi:uncharacterized Zn finger protein
MSGGASCACKPRDVEIVTFKGNYSAFNGYRWQRSAYSLVRCRTCGTFWRTKAKWVDRAPFAPTDEPCRRAQPRP